ncbi:MAG: cation diffusion facilitator family transporter [Elusimicrobia bacterium]|nr:cation diffusion facilitator family transporter [Elusimicrobiota bacterium]
MPTPSPIPAVAVAIPAAAQPLAALIPNAVAFAVPVAHPNTAKPSPPLAAPGMAPAQSSVFFDGAIIRSAASAGDEPENDPKPAFTPRQPRDLPQRFTSRLARWSGAVALYSIYRDGVLVQRYASRLNDTSLPPARRAVAARMLSSLGRVETIPALGWAHENDPSPRVRRAALAALIRLARAAEPKLIRTLSKNPRSGPREAAATTLAWLVRHDDAPAAVEALSDAGALDPSEDARLAAIQALSTARSPKAHAALEWMRSREERPHMRSALELALVEARRRQTGPGLQAYRQPPDELADTRGPLHEVALKRALVVASLFAVVELIGGFVTGNVALKADAIHLASDQLIGLAALFSIWMSRRPPNSRKSYGYLKVESVVGLAGSAMIAFMGFEMGMEAWHRFFTPGAAATWSVALFALASLAANAISAALLWRHHGESLSMKGAFLHAATDAIGSIGVILSAAAAIRLGWTWVEPVAVVLIVAMIAKTAWELGRPAWNILIDAVPAGIDLDKIEADLLAIPGAAGVHDLHVWALNSTMTTLTATLFIKPGTDHDQALAAAKAVLTEKHGIRHLTVQIETIKN